MRQRVLILCAALLALVAAGCGVATYRAAPLQGRLEVRLVARPGAPGERVRRARGHEVLRLERRAILESSHVREVQLEDAPDGQRYVVLHLTDIGRRRLADATGRHLGRRLAFVVAGQVVMAPTIRTTIDEGIAHVAAGDAAAAERVFETLTRERTAPPAARRGSREGAAGTEAETAAETETETETAAETEAETEAEAEAEAEAETDAGTATDAGTGAG